MPVPPGQPGPNGTPPSQPAPGQPGTPATPDAANNNQPASPVMRPSTPPEPPNRKEFEIQPDSDGKIQFNFRNQPWPELLRWLSNISNMSLDWQQLPGDFVNIATTRPYSIEETRDLVNRLLLLRGYTMLEIGDVLMVTKTEGINVALVPYVSSDELDDLPPNRFVKTSFQLSFLLAEDIAEEIKDLKSSNGKITPLTTTNRLEIMDAAVVLKGIARLLDEEQSTNVREQLAREFVLEYVRAPEVKEQIEAFLGKQQSGAAANPSDPMQMQMQMQMQQQMQQMQQQMAQQQMAAGGGGGGAKRARPTDVYLVANKRQNSVIVHAPPNKMAIIAAFIDRVDVPSETADDLQTMLNRVKVYRLSSLAPQQLVTSLLSMDALEPTTKIEVDEKNKSITVNASLADHYTIAQIIKKLDGSAREFEVVPLRRLEAEEVAGTIRMMMGVDQEEEESNDNDYFYSFYSYRNRNNKEKAKPDKFRVASNSRDNQLLIWANDSEREEVNKLLMKLGEIPPSGGFASKTRVLDADRSAETLEYLKKLQERWSEVSETPLVLPDPASVQKPADDEEETQPDPTDEEEEGESEEPSQEKSRKKITDQSKSASSKLVGTPADSAESNDAGTSEQPPRSKPTDTRINDEPATERKRPAITIEFDQNGNLVLKGDDTKALDKLEELMLQQPPPKKPFTVFEIKHTRASWIVMNLKDYFKDAENEDSGRPNGRVYYFYESYGRNDDKKKDDRQLSSNKKPLKFVYDIDTNTVIVRNASTEQLDLIAELIKLWDTPAKTSDRDLRYTELVRVQYSKADAIVETIKDAYRDLLSSNDKAFQQNPAGGGAGSGEEKRDQDEDVVRNGAVNFTFEGKLSLGVDRVTNSVLVSAQGKSLLALIVKMVKQLDDAAKPAGATSVVRLPASSNASSMQKALEALLNKQQQQNPQQPDPNAQQPPQQPPQNPGMQARGGRNR
jgi:type II secretory pathway component GspD/PulD (secretin)